MASDPRSGYLYVSDASNNRISVYSAWGNFIRAFGWDVAPGAVNEVQELRVRAAAGQLRLAFGASTTPDLPFDAPAAEVQAALDALPSISAGGGSVTVTGGPGSADGAAAYMIAFDGGPLAGTDVAQISASNGATPLSGGSPSSALSVASIVEGTAGGAGFESCTAEAGCQAGSGGTGSGQFSEPNGIAVDDTGNVYVADSGNHRIEKFDAAGRFLLMLGKEVDATSGGDVCAAASGDQCQAGAAGSGPGEVSGGLLAIDQAGDLLSSGLEERIQVFDQGGAYLSEFALPNPLAAMAADPSAPDLYVSLYADRSAQEDTKKYENKVRKLSLSGEELGAQQVLVAPTKLVVDPQGDLYVGHQALLPEGNEDTPEVAEFDPGGTEAGHCCRVPGDQGQITSLASNGAGDLYVSSRLLSPGPETNYITAYGPPPLKYGPPPEAAPQVDSQYLAAADATSARLRAQIDPEFWGDTTYYLEYGTEPCSLGGCASQPAPPGVDLGPPVKRDLTTPDVVLTGLQPGTAYHYRFVARTVFGPGEESVVRGVGGRPGEDGAEATFTTFPASQAAPGACANDAYRAGTAAGLPDCRAYEMVSPLEKNNGDIRSLVDITGYETHFYQAAGDGDSFTYSSYRAFGGAEGAPYTAQYLARRGPAGWASEALGGPLTKNFYNTAVLDDEFKAFSPDLCQAWLVPNGESPLVPGQVEGFPNLYRRENCPKTYEALTTAPPPILDSKYYFPELQGHSADGSVAVFRVSANLTPEAPPQPAGCNPHGVSCQTRVYEASGGDLRYVCVFPEGTSAKAEAELPSCSAGTSGTYVGESPTNRIAYVTHAVSEDGSRVYWTAYAGPVKEKSPVVAGRIYLRLNGAATVKVSETETTKPARFWGAAADGSKALFEVEDPEHASAKDRNLYLYDLGAEESTLIAGKALGVAAASEDLSRIYFVSEEALEGSGQNSEGAEALAGKPNLYLEEEGSKAFVATLSSADTAPIERFSDTSIQPVYQAAQATPDGTRLAFISTEPLTGSDNTDLRSAKADSELFTYDAQSGQLACASCSPAGARPAGRDAETPAGKTLWSAATIPTPQTELNAPRALSPDGSRLFFTSYADLLPSDSNGAADVYEWERAGAGSCQSQASPQYYPRDGGCLYLLSSGEGATDSEFIDSGGPGGRDAFFTSDSSLLPQDPGLVDVYDAREGGGLSGPQAPPAACEGEACQGPASPPDDPTPASAAFQGAGNVREGAARRHRRHHRHRHRHAKRHAHPKRGSQR